MALGKLKKKYIDFRLVLLLAGFYLAQTFDSLNFG